MPREAIFPLSGTTPQPVSLLLMYKKGTGASIFELQPFSQKSRTPTGTKQFQIGLCGVLEADLELFCNCWSAVFLGERLYSHAPWRVL